jgi:molybdate transport system substrate-binding protein
MHDEAEPLRALNILSAGAAQAVVVRLAQAIEREGRQTVRAHCGAVQAIKALVAAGEPADVIILSAALMTELIRDGAVVAWSRVELGSVATAIAVRAGDPLPGVADGPALKAALLEARRIVCPDPAIASAGQVFIAALGRLGILEQVQGRLEFCANGKAVAARLAAASDAGELGVMQSTEILADRAVTLAGPLPAELQQPTVYACGLSARAAQPARAIEFMRRLTSDGRALQAAGFVAVPKAAAGPVRPLAALR